MPLLLTLAATCFLPGAALADSGKTRSAVTL